MQLLLEKKQQTTTFQAEPEPPTSVPKDVVLTHHNLVSTLTSFLYVMYRMQYPQEDVHEWGCYWAQWSQFSYRQVFDDQERTAR
jgi:hypothetical protein